MANGDVSLDCGLCVLRAWREDDVTSLVRHADNYYIWRNLRDGFPHPYTREDAECWISVARERESQTALAIDVDGEAVGGITLSWGSDIERCSTEIGYWLGEILWGRGSSRLPCAP